MTISDTGRELQPGARQPMTNGRRLGLAVALMAAWPTVAYGFGALPLPVLQPQWFPHLGVLVTNALAGTVVLAGAWSLGLIGPQAGNDRGLGRAGIRAGSGPRSHLWLLPLLAIALSYAFIGKGSTPGITGTLGYLASAAVGLLAVGVSEELASRGIPLGLAAPSGKWRSVLTVALIFGLWHVGNFLFFGQSLDETAWQVLVSAVYGFVLGAGRLVVGSIWPLAFLHGLNDWMQLNSPGAAPFWYQVTVMVFEVIWGTVMLTVAVRSPVITGESSRRAETQA
ncbi:CPBP family intramembrane metalloprotease [Rhodococcus oryzae]|uniref:CPBP family intramembrane metalloprotease n=1 Tax=Rhodococcus oryzae TaxID=2571143 RepID=A0ABY2RG66_9NOCA|nr:type II CAAX endopeptidase family protein [Rhodococcus oryzae]TJZ73249.1 CPBP family intramembrane metalloprotease [Rhodococcus oryzae]